MRYLIFGLAVIVFFGYLVIPSYAYHVKCYSGDRLIYSGEAYDIEYDGYSIITHTKGEEQNTFVTGACVVRP